MGTVFLTPDEVLALDEDQIRRYAGSAGLPDPGLLSSALGAVAATFAGRFLHQDLFGMAAGPLPG